MANNIPYVITHGYGDFGVADSVKLIPTDGFLSTEATPGTTQTTLFPIAKT